MQPKTLKRKTCRNWSNVKGCQGLLKGAMSLPLPSCDYISDAKALSFFLACDSDLVQHFVFNNQRVIDAISVSAMDNNLEDLNVLV